MVNCRSVSPTFQVLFCLRSVSFLRFGSSKASSRILQDTLATPWAPGDRQGTARRPPGDRRGTARGPPGDHQGTARGPPGDRQIAISLEECLTFEAWDLQGFVKDPPGHPSHSLGARGPPGDRQETARGPPGDRQGTTRGPPGDRQGTARGPPGDRQGTARGPPDRYFT